MGTWQWTPDYTLTIRSQGGTFTLRGVVEAQAMLVVAGGMNQMQVSVADADHMVQQVVNPQPMDVIRLALKNRFGVWDVAWTGYVDSVTRVTSPQQGDLLTLSCTGPYKLWEITLQEGGDSYFNFATALANNVTGTAMLEYSALKVGFPLINILIDPLADSGSGYNASAFQNAAWTPNLQSWSSVIEAFLANSGLEFFFDEYGRGIWRRVGFLNRPLPRPLLADEVISAGFSAGDQGVYTDILVRTQFGGDPGGNGTWRAPDAMRQHLKDRTLVVYAPWITANTQQADYLAQILGLQSAAGVLQGQVVLPADPTIRVGSVLYVPPLPITAPQTGVAPAVPDPTAGGSFYYVKSVTYQLQWGGPWQMTLGLAYGRSRSLAFPYFTGADGRSLSVTYPVPDLSSIPTGGTDAPVNDQTLSTFVWSVASPSLVQGLTLTDDQVGVDPNLFDTQHQRQIMVKGTDGSVLGHSANGYLTMVSGLGGSQTLFINNVPPQMATIVDPLHNALTVATVAATAGIDLTPDPPDTRLISAVGPVPSGSTDTTGSDLSSAGAAGNVNDGTTAQVQVASGADYVSAAQLVYLARTVGVPENQIVTAVEVALAESGGTGATQSAIGAKNYNKPNPTGGDACARSGSWDLGVWQINDCYHSSYDRTKLFTDPLYNAKAMFAISNSGTDWGPWSTYPTAAATHKDTAQAAFAAVPPGTVPSGFATVSTVSTGTNDPAATGANGSFSVLPVVDTAHDVIQQIFGGIIGEVGPIITSEEAYTTGDGIAYTHFHNGVDLGYGIVGLPVQSVIAGTVALAESVGGTNGPPEAPGDHVFYGYNNQPFSGWRGFGNLILVQSLDKKLVIFYAHLSQFNVSKGDSVGVGTVLGLMGATGNADGAHLHFGVFDTSYPRTKYSWYGGGYYYGEWIDPRTYYVKSGTLPGAQQPLDGGGGRT